MNEGCQYALNIYIEELVYRKTISHFSHRYEIIAEQYFKTVSHVNQLNSLSQGSIVVHGGIDKSVSECGGHIVSTILVFPRPSFDNIVSTFETLPPH